MTAIMTPSQTGSTPGMASKAGATIGTTTKMISKASITKPKEEHRDHHREYRAGRAARKIGERTMHEVVAAEAAKDETEQGRADQDDENHRCDLRGLDHRRTDDLRQFRPPRREQDRADRADRCGFRRRRDAAEDRAEHREDQKQAARPEPRSACAPSQSRAAQHGSTGIAGEDFGKTIAIAIR